ncbi:MAG TPA: general secretion pathway protein GspB [Xanthomonadaceae bacterium]|nr:general secretion pathway protein GspB [Xanthomonadaceae bacterium]
MSLILDALRKSEAERRRGNLPALALELPPAPPRAMRTSAWWLAAPVVVFLAAAVFWITRPEDMPLQPAPPAATTPVPAMAAARPASMPVAETPGTGVAAVANPPATRVSALEPEPAPGPAPALALEPAPARGPVPAPGPIANPADTTPENARTNDPPAFALADLTADERRALPPLKLSMHMWSPVPADRFVILDGHRLGEGDRAGHAVVERIDQHGVILAADGRRIRLPLP